MKIQNVPGPSQQAKVLIATWQKVRLIESGKFYLVNPSDAYSLCSYRSFFCFLVCH